MAGITDVPEEWSAAWTPLDIIDPDDEPGDRRRKADYRRRLRVAANMSGGDKHGVVKVMGSERAALLDYAMQFAPEAIDCIVNIMRTTTAPHTRLRAAEVLLDRVLGRPHQAVAVTSVSAGGETDDRVLVLRNTLLAAMVGQNDDKTLSLEGDSHNVECKRS